MFIGGDYVGHPSHIGRKCVFKVHVFLPSGTERHIKLTFSESVSLSFK